jgi:hypothetical protein
MVLLISLPLKAVLLRSLLTLFCVVAYCGDVFAGPWPGGSFRLGYGVQSGPHGFGLNGERLEVMQASLDIQPGLLPWTIGLDFLTSFEHHESLQMTMNSGQLDSAVQKWTCSIKWHQELVFCDLYAGAGMGVLVFDQDFRAGSSIEHRRERSFFPVFIFGITDVPIFFPVLGWGVEFRYAQLDSEGIVELAKDSRSWLLTCGVSW